MKDYILSCTHAYTDVPQCSGKNKLTDGERIELVCESSFSGADMPSLEWFEGTMATSSEDNAEIGTARRRLVMDSAWNLDKVTFTCRMSFGDMVEECGITLDVKCE